MEPQYDFERPILSVIFDNTYPRFRSRDPLLHPDPHLFLILNNKRNVIYLRLCWP